MPVPVKTGMTPPPMPGMPAPMGGMPPAQNPFAPMPPMPLAGAPMPQPPMPMPPMAQGQMPQGQQMMGSTAGRRRRFGDALEGMLGRNQGIGAAMPQQQRPMPMPPMMPQQRMVAPGTPMMRTPTPRPMAMGGEVDIFGYDDGGMVPRQTMIADEPHMLAYINQDEEALLRSFGGSGISGPGGIPSYPLQDLGVGAINSGKTYTSSSVDWDKVFAANDDSPSNVTSAPTGDVDFTTIDPTTGQQTTVATIDFGDDDDDGPVIKDVTYYDDTGTTEIDAPVVTTDTAYVDPNTGGVTIYDEPSGPASVYTPTPVYTDRFGREYSSQALADAADRAYAAQMASYGAGQETVNELQRGIAEAFPNASREEANRLANKAYLDYGTDLAAAKVGEAPLFSYAGIGGIGGSDSPSGAGVTATPTVDPDVGTSQAPNIFDPTGSDISLESAINLNAPVARPGDDDEDYTPSAEQLAKQLEAANQTNVTQGPMSVAEQTAQYRPETEMLGIIDEERQQDADISAEQALNRIERGDSGAQTPSTANVAPDETPSQTSTQTTTSPTSQDLNKGLGAGTSTDTGETEAERMKRLYGLEARGLGAGDDPRRANLAVNAAEAKYLQNLLKQFEFDKDGKMVAKEPNVVEKVLGQVVKNLSLGLIDVNDLDQKRVQAVLDAYRDTGSFVYDTEGNSIDLKTVADLEKLERLSAGRGQEPAVIGIRDKDGNVVSYGPDIKNTMEGPVTVIDDDIFSTMTSTDTDTDTDTNGGGDTGHKDGVCNNPDYVYNPETDKCEPKKEEDTGGDLGSPITSAITPRSFDDVLRSVVVPAPDIAPISANIRPMQAGGMVGLNRAADNFIKALAG